MRKKNIAHHKFFVKVTFVLPGSHSCLFAFLCHFNRIGRDLLISIQNSSKVGCNNFFGHQNKNVFPEKSTKRGQNAFPFLVSLPACAFSTPWATFCHQSSCPSEPWHFSRSRTSQIFGKGLLRQRAGAVPVTEVLLGTDSDGDKTSYILKRGFLRIIS